MILATITDKCTISAVISDSAVIPDSAAIKDTAAIKDNDMAAISAVIKDLGTIIKDTDATSADIKVSAAIKDAAAIKDTAAIKDPAVITDDITVPALVGPTAVRECSIQIPVSKW